MAELRTRAFFPRSLNCQDSEAQEPLAGGSGGVWSWDPANPPEKTLMAC